MSSRAQQVDAEYSPDPTSPLAARRLVRGALRDWHLEHLTDAATLLVSELATNAVLHARTPFSVRVERTAATVRITVLDCSGAGPARRSHGLGASTGRGLALVATLAESWGTRTDVQPWSKAVWCELSCAA
jgi:anti-sigma regulatory factor (Ser/Thr protein kinase)